MRPPLNFIVNWRKCFMLLNKMLILFAIILVAPSVQCTTDNNNNNNKHHTTILKPSESFHNTGTNSANSSMTNPIVTARNKSSKLYTSNNTSAITSNGFGRTSTGAELASSSWPAPKQQRNNHLDVNTNTTAHHNQTSFDFVIFKDGPSSMHQQQFNKSSLNQLERHSYNLTTSLMTAKNSTAMDPLDVSDSRPQIARYDTPDYSDESNSYADELEAAAYDEENLIDGASNMNEKKVVKELTKILSKGMSGATDQVRVETLENLKRRQRERKQLKDSRAKLFEEILTAAINSHPEKLKKTKGKSRTRYNSASSNLKSSASSSGSSSGSSSPSSNSNGGDASNMDTDLGPDAETVLQHLQGLAGGGNSYDGSSSSGGFTSSGGYSSSPTDALGPAPMMSEADGGSDDSSQLSEPSNDPSVSERPKKSQSSSSSSDRPIVRQFKKIKNQISQRRKQLDQIKKLFNIELALNPKDGSLVGKQVQQSSSSSSGTKKRPRQTPVSSMTLTPMEPVEPQPDEFSDDTDGYVSKRSRSPSGTPVKNDKARELLTYLRDNPEILASVMAELTVDADPSTGRSQSGLMGRAQDDSTSTYQQLQQQQQQLSQEYDEISLGSLKNKRLSTRYPSSSQQQLQQQYQQQQQQQLMAMDSSDEMAGLGRSKRARRTNSDSVRVVNEYDPILTAIRRSRASSTPTTYTSAPIQTSRSSLSSKSTRPSAEELLLESLRERQLLNLARLDLVLAERAAPNKTSMSLLNASQQNGGASDGLMFKSNQYSQFDQLEGIRRNGHDESGSRALASNYSSASMIKLENNTNRSDDELTHHYMSAFAPSHTTTTGDELTKQQHLRDNNNNNNNLYLNSASSFGPAGVQMQLQQPQQHLPIQQQQQMLQRQMVHHTLSSLQQPNGLLRGAAGGFGGGSGLGGSNFSIVQQQQYPTNSNSQYQLGPYDPNRSQPSLSSAEASTLGRFKNWRDVSQEASSWQSNRASSPLGMNMSLSPYDLTTGSLASSMGIESIVKSPPGVAPTTMTTMMKSQSTNNDNTGATSSSSNNAIEPLNHQNQPNLLDQSISSINRERIPTNQPSGEQAKQKSMANYWQAHQNQRYQREFPDHQSHSNNMLNDTQPAQSSSAAEQDVSTVKLTTYDDHDKDTRTQQSARKQNNRGTSMRMDDMDGTNDRREDYQGSSSSGRQSLRGDEEEELVERGDYFRSYKEDESPNSRRRSMKQHKYNQHTRRQQGSYQSPDMDSGDQEIDDAGAMWA